VRNIDHHYLGEFWVPILHTKVSWRRFRK